MDKLITWCVKAFNHDKQQIIFFFAIKKNNRNPSGLDTTKSKGRLSKHTGVSMWFFAFFISSKKYYL